MTKEDPSGLLSKVVRFVRNPTTGWNELDEQEETRDSNYNKAALKEMIERKRRNDFVRRREFDQLRKLRKREALGPAVDAQGRPSFFQSSLASRPDDRAVTLKKIDEIEAQMSMQWWRSKHGHPPTAAAEGGAQGNPLAGPAGQVTFKRPPGSAPSQDTVARAFAPTVDAPLSALGGGPRPSSVMGTSLPDGHWDSPQGNFSGFAATAVEVPLPHGAHSSDFSGSRFMGAETPAFTHPPELEEAAIRFANGDTEGAEASLLELLQQPSVASQQLIWMSLFDLYRSNGDQSRFELAALDFAGRFGRSAPLWQRFGFGEGSSRLGSIHGDLREAQAGYRWAAADIVSVQALATLKAMLERAPQPWELDWTRLVDVQEAAVQPLARLIAGWSASKVRLRWIGAAVFDDVLRARTVSGDPSVDEGWWQLRMESLRMMGRAEEFELVALDYCVTYEVSPPSWLAPLCECVVLASDDGAGVPFEEVQHLQASTFQSEFASTALGLDIPHHDDLNTVPAANVELSGVVVGDVVGLLPVPEAGDPVPRVVVVGCERLIRVDFSAAGSVLNWAAARQAEGSQVQFHELQRLVAVFFNVIGINEHARVIPRQD
jgi:hypothetical protein